MINPRLIIKAGDDVTEQRLNSVRSRLMASLTDAASENEDQIEVIVENNAIRLRSRQLNQRATIGISFHDGAANHRRLYGGGKSQLLAKAVGIDQKKDLNIVDATAGLAGDSFVMASLGARLQMIEQSPVLALMIEEALLEAKRVQTAPAELLAVLDRMSIVQADASAWLSQQVDKASEVIFLDPMFPEKKKKAAVKKEMQILQHLLLEAEKDEAERQKEEARLLELALAKTVNRVVVKRPRHAPSLSGDKPSYSLEGKSTRFDIYAIKKIG